MITCAAMVWMKDSKGFTADIDAEFGSDEHCNELASIILGWELDANVEWFSWLNPRTNKWRKCTRNGSYWIGEEQ